MNKIYSIYSGQTQTRIGFVMADSALEALVWSKVTAQIYSKKETSPGVFEFFTRSTAGTIEKYSVRFESEVDPTLGGAIAERDKALARVRELEAEREGEHPAVLRSYGSSQNLREESDL
jgi:hypothetical protein